MGTMRRLEYRAYDEIVTGDIVDIGGIPRRVVKVIRDDADRVRWISIDRLHGGDPVYIYHAALESGPRRFCGWFKRTRSGREEP